MKGLLYKNEYAISDKIKIIIPKVRDLIKDEASYYSNITLITATPYDMMVQLDDIGIDFTKIDDFELFCAIFNQLAESDTSLIFGDLNLTNFIPARINGSDEIILYDEINDITIDKTIYSQICEVLRLIHGYQRVNKRPANEEAKKFMIERARIKQKRERRKSKIKTTTQLEDLIISLVNTAEFPYNYQSALDLTIYQFNSSLYQIIDKVRFDNLMIGCYAGTIDTDKLSKDELSWIK